MLSIDYMNRIAKVRERMREENLDVLVATKLASVHYLAGTFIPWRSAVVIPMNGPVSLTTTSIDSERVAHGTWIDDMRPWELAMRSPTLVDVVASVISEAGAAGGKIGLEMDNLTILEYQDLTQRLPQVTVRNTAHLIDLVMLIKEPAEIERMRRAAEVCDLGAEAAIQFIRPGVTETEIAGVVEQATRAAGSEWNWAVTGGTEVGSGYRQSYARGWSQPATTKRVQRGDVVTIDIHPMIELYCGDLAFNVSVGQPSERLRNVESVWKEAIAVMLDNMNSGTVIGDAARKTREVIKRSGLHEYCSTLLGHGLGTDSKMPPVVSEVNNTVFQPNMMVELVVNITVPNLGGLRTETMVLITDRGPEVLNRIPHELIVV
jgi:Xaa-Pro dipeptidase